ncbi:hypothetical protein SPRG_07718 [Saprolegnia parasitica CBS 223.65]|uniref:DUF155 domain-containing protein n=1 Tax=Saprolegnia parasitica (strain CBS 223.65) TaxID=695850 RepID=A0A067CKC0_SAPPC|nr:hypothetical protein SPRG_07718 [Saprolegnia parasitica CBS 223.65]KDO27006.1 hypothetical protein SPRG_07718 [Saprolegnia parasitica CBS 223.65]|eukprot:XP_012202383.1 hypothetical protein SPRG_07718 [Saprolegnia parasitica CBS 223.65]
MLRRGLLSTSKHLLGRPTPSFARSASSLPRSAAAVDATDVSQTIAQAMAEEERKRKRKAEHMPIRAVHLARKMDIVSLFQRLYTDRFKVSHYLYKDSVVLRLSSGNDNAPNPWIAHLNNSVKTSASTFPPELPPSAALPENPEIPSRRAKDKWVVYFDYGAVVFFNCDDSLTTTLIKHAKKLLLVADPTQKGWSELKENNIRVQEIDHVNIQVIAGVLAQTVALEHYERQVEAILAEFEKLNTLVEKKGPQTALFGLSWSGAETTEKEQHRKLFQIVATNNTLLIDLVSKLRVIDRKRPGDAAWTHTRYHNMWETLLEEFELSERFNNLNFKLELIQHNTKFFLEVLSSYKGTRMEWYIIILIAAELAISAYELAMKLH